MLLAWTTSRPADLARALGAPLDAARRVELPLGRALVCWPVAEDQRGTCVLHVEVPPGVLEAPIGASRLLAVALADVFAPALAGDAADIGELPLTVELPPVLPGAGEVARRLFAPLGYAIEPSAPGLVLRHVLPAPVLLAHLCVLWPALDTDPRPRIGDDRVQDLLRHGADWLDRHPERELVHRRYRERARWSEDPASARLWPAVNPVGADASETRLVDGIPLGELRLRFATRQVSERGARSVLVLGCGEVRLIERLLGDPRVERVTAVDGSAWALDDVARRLASGRYSESARAKLSLVRGSLVYGDERLAGHDLALCTGLAAAPRWPAFVDAILGVAAPGALALADPPDAFGVAAERWGYDTVDHVVGAPDPAIGPSARVALATRRA